MTDCPIAIFAHNEERNIRRSIESVFAAFDGQQRLRPRIHVLVNGSTDRTAEVVRTMQQEHPDVRLVEIRLGDKCNAWNHYVYEIAEEASVHFFMDGDVMMGREAAARMMRKLESHPEATAVASLPWGGRRAAAYREELLEGPAIWGNLYGLRDVFLQSVRRRGIRLPIGIVFDDGLINFLNETDLEPEKGVIHSRTVVADDAFFLYKSLKWYSPAEIRIYVRRRIRYSIGRYQFKILGPLLKARGVQVLPEVIADLYGPMDRYQGPTRGGGNIMFDFLAARRMRKEHRSAKVQASAD